ncbi:MAG: hypothetical protein AAB802_02465 [Patescibacteria group bacterium]
MQDFEKLPEPIPEIKEEKIGEELEALEDEVLGPDLDELTPDELHEQVDIVNASSLEFLRLQSQSENAGIAERAQFQMEVWEDMDALMKEIHGLIETEDFESAEKSAVAFLEKQITRLQEMGLKDEFINSVIKEMQDLINLYGDMVEQNVVVASEKMELLSTGLDLVPFVSGAKMLVEAGAGKDMAGHKMSSGGRLMHAAEGAVWLTVDLVGAGAGAATAGTGTAVVEGVKYATMAPKGAKVLSRGAAVLRATAKGNKTLNAGSKVLFNAGRFLVKHPRIAKRADEFVELAGDTRKLSALAAPVKAGEVMVEKKKSSEILDRLNKERQELRSILDEAFDQKMAA